MELRRVRVGDGWAAALVLVGYPASLSLGWIETLTGAHTRIEVSVHIDNVPSDMAASRLHKRRARLESSRRYAAHRGRLDEPEVDVAAHDAAELADRVARGQARLHRLAVYVTVHAETERDLELACARLRAGASAAMMDVRPATARQLPGLIATVPLGIDPVGATRTVDTETASAVFPFGSADVPGSVVPASVLYGLNLVSGGPVLWDRWSQENHNSILLAQSGAGKSYLTKCEVLRQLYQGVQVTILDPEDEYSDLAAHVGGSVRRPGGPEVALNPLELRDHSRADALARRCLFVRTVVETLLGEKLDSAVSACLLETVRVAYTERGITDDPATWAKPVPTLADVVRLLATSSGGSDLANRIGPYTGPGSMFALSENSTEASGPLRIWVLADVPDELRPVVTLMVLDQVTPPVRSDGRWHLIVVDEAWTWLKEREGAEFIAALAKSARKRLVGLAVVTQDADDVLTSQLGRTVLNNAATQLLMRQAPQAIDTVAEACKLTGAERALVGSARVGEALLLSGETHVAFRACASETEHRLCLTGRSRFQSGGA
ncbi:VirB4 family type IV secretion system protein [Glycomyces sp. NRRL B-16210]|uniref:VirB4 family type IV secretion system protein n=1 Tax=Glycomyces sp. NRRL B-16210 TaxID=1463821 RepID=UPI00105CED96|nr:DUF87 domain-containing protein [Glycomyces sp. NRRL B-16210]